MNILILCTYYPPDTAISAVRPHMLAKYLVKSGHNVTVIRSGELNHRPDKNLIDQNDGVKIYSFLGENSAAERFSRGELDADFNSSQQKRLNSLPTVIRTPLAFIYRGISFPVTLFNYFKTTRTKAKKQQELIDKLDDSFDVVFATYSNLENAYSGAYAAKKWSCKYVLDFRDLVAQKSTQSFIEYCLKSIVQKKVISQADVCTTVSEGLSQKIKKQFPNKEVYTLYNGYENNTCEKIEFADNQKLSFCYAGTLYKGARDASPIFEALQQLNNDEKIDLNKIAFHYAGNEFEYLQKQAASYGVSNILINHGYVTKSEIHRLQATTDVFVVLSWNTKNEQGILTGKFYESLLYKKPVIASISGNKPQSELRQIISKYNLGTCFEQADKKATAKELYDYISGQYNQKMSGSTAIYEPKAEVFEKFEYSGIAKQLEKIVNM